MTEMAEKKIHQAMFLQLILQYQTTAMIGMGKIKNPMTDKIEREMDHAKFSIDMLDMLKSKTNGNLESDEEKFLDQILRDLKLNYVEESGKDKTSSKSENDKTETKSADFEGEKSAE
ncbi:MAG: DUF1844 domain-containing protein [Ignavibacteria bacterium]|nr:DUF1844 domain-containing protein [Ignavibacteria bacterium]